MSKKVEVRNGKMTLVKQPVITPETKKNLVKTASPVVAVGVLSTGLAIAAHFPILIPLLLCMMLTLGLMRANVVAKSEAKELTPEEKERLELEAKDKAVKEWVSTPDAPVEKKYLSEYDCSNYEQTSFDLKLAEEDVISIQDVTTCDDGGKRENYCLLCRPILIRQNKDRKAREEAERDERQREHDKWMREAAQRRAKRATESDVYAMGLMSEEDSQRLLDLRQTVIDNGEPWGKTVTTCKNHPENNPVETWFPVVCPNCLLKALKAEDERQRLAKIQLEKERRAAAKAEKERLFEKRRHVQLNGLHLVRPLKVPEGAVPSIMHGRDIDPMATHSFVVWKWTEDGKNTKFYKQPVVVDAITVSSAEGPIKTIYSTYDGEGNYLGDYTTVNGHLPEDRHLEALKVHFKDDTVKIEKRVKDIEKWAWGDNKPERLKE
jgi:hypothetical protein